MTYSADIRWRIVSLIHVYDIDIDFISKFFLLKTKDNTQMVPILQEVRSPAPLGGGILDQKILMQKGFFCRTAEIAQDRILRP